MESLSGTILYYVVGPVHPRNAQHIAEAMPGWTFKLLYETDAWWMNREQMTQIPFEKFAFVNAEVPDTLCPKQINAVVFSTIQPRQAPMNLLSWALANHIPTIAIEESNQIALNHGAINNYLLPVDRILVASAAEKRGLLEAGVSKQRVNITGWPFYTGPGPGNSRTRRRAKVQLGLDPDRPVAALTLTALNDAGETTTVRRTQLELASQGLPEQYQLVIKPHPIEKMGTLMPFVNEYAPRSRVLDGSIPVNDLLQASDVLLNRGVSQVSIEALLGGIPVVVLSVGDKTPFHDLVPELVVEHSKDLTSALAHLYASTDPMRFYRTFFLEHIPHPFQARALTCKKILRVMDEDSLGTDQSEQWLDWALFQAWQLDRQKAFNVLNSGLLNHLLQQATALQRLIRFQASQADLTILENWYSHGYKEHVLRCLWVDFLDQKKQHPTSKNLNWMADFPPHVNTHLFLTHCTRWVRILLRSGHLQTAKEFVQKLHESQGHHLQIAQTYRDVRLYEGDMFPRARYELCQLARWGRKEFGIFRSILRNFLLK